MAVEVVNGGGDGGGGGGGGGEYSWEDPRRVEY